MALTAHMSSLSHHVPPEDVTPTIEELRYVAKEFCHAIAGKVPDGRCQALAYTKLEEALMWAVKGIVTES